MERKAAGPSDLTVTGNRKCLEDAFHANQWAGWWFIVFLTEVAGCERPLPQDTIFLFSLSLPHFDYETDMTPLRTWLNTILNLTVQKILQTQDRINRKAKLDV